MASSSNDYTELLPPAYRESRHVETLEAVWEPILYQKLGRHLDLIKEGVKGFTLVRSNIRRSLTETLLERDETAETIIQHFLNRKFPGVDDLISQIGPLVSQYPSQVAPEAVMVCDEDDRRSFTMDVEPGSSDHRKGEQSMGPPPRPVAPLTPGISARPRDVGHQSNSEALSIPEFPGPLSSDDSHGSPSFLRTQAAKRLLDAMEVDHPRSPESATKKARIAPRWASLVTKSLDFQDVEGKQYIFKDIRCGDGVWLVVWCGRGQQMPFLEHPLRGKGALDHWRRKGHPCHDTGITSAYELDDIVQEFAYRGKDLSGNVGLVSIRTDMKTLSS
jgi:hypothetical protein